MFYNRRKGKIGSSTCVWICIGFITMLAVVNICFVLNYMDFLNHKDDPRTSKIINDATKKSTIIKDAQKTTTVIKYAQKTTAIIIGAPKTTTIIKGAPKTTTIIKDAQETSTMIKVIPIIKEALNTLTLIKDAPETTTIIKDAPETTTIIKDAQKTTTIIKEAPKTFPIVQDDIAPIFPICAQHYRDTHYAIVDQVNGRTGNILFQVYCLLAVAAPYCYTPVLSARDDTMRHFDSIFDLHNVTRISMYEPSSLLIASGVAHRNFDPEVLEPHDVTRNWTLIGLFKSWRYFIGHEHLIRSSVTFKKTVSDEVGQYVKETFPDRQIACIQVRRTDKIKNKEEFKKYKDLDWYKPYILRAMDLLAKKHGDLAFIFISDDISWCREQFEFKDHQSHEIHFSPYKEAGHDLALMSFCNHSVLTIGTFGWMGAWLSGRGTVIYQATRLPSHYYAGGDFFLPEWIGIP